LGKFIYCLKDENIQVIDVNNESPDFLIKVNNCVIGIEIIGVIDENNIKPITTNKLLEEAEIEFEKRYPNIKLTAIFTFENWELSFNKKNKSKLIDQLCSVVYNWHLKNYDFVYPEFITDIKIRETKSLSFDNIWVGYCGDVNRSIIDEKIKKKEKLIEKYKENSKLNEQWLLIVTNAGLPNSYDIEEDEIKEMNFTSLFQRVYLLEELYLKLTRLV